MDLSYCKICDYPLSDNVYFPCCSRNCIIKLNETRPCKYCETKKKLKINDHVFQCCNEKECMEKYMIEFLDKTRKEQRGYTSIIHGLKRKLTIERSVHENAISILTRQKDNIIEDMRLDLKSIQGIMDLAESEREDGQINETLDLYNLMHRVKAVKKAKMNGRNNLRISNN